MSNKTTEPKAKWSIAVFAYNEEKLIGNCLKSLPLKELGDSFSAYIIVNGTTDQTADIVRKYANNHGNLHLHVLKKGGKSNAWNYYVHEISVLSDIHFFMDGDCRIVGDALNKLATGLGSEPDSNAAAAVPMSGRSRESLVQEMKKDGGLAGNLYALRGVFVERIKKRGIRLPEGLIGDDSWVGAFSATDLGKADNWDKSRTVVCEDAFFMGNYRSIWKIQDWIDQYRRMISYGVRHIQNQGMKEIMHTEGPDGLPETIREIYERYPQHMKLCWRGYWTYFDWLALRGIKWQMRHPAKRGTGTSEVMPRSVDNDP